MKRVHLMLLVFLFTILLYGCKDPVTFSINYDLDGGTCEDLVTSFNENEKVILATPTKNGYIFLGWYEGDIKIQIVDNRDYNLLAKWEEEIVEVYNTTSCQIQNGDYLLDGEILSPISLEKVPAVIIVPGSGGMDMDGTVRSQKPYKELAIKLAKSGVASIRFHKVNYQYVTSLTAAYDFSIKDEYLDAIESCILLLKQDSTIDQNRIYLIGHSMGAQIIPVILDKDKTLAGGIVMAGSTAHILDLLLEQVKKESEALYQEYLPYCNYAKSLDSVPVGEEKYFYFGAYSAYYVSYNKIERQLIKDLECPMLIMQGELDIQVSMNHYQFYEELLKNNELVYFKKYDKLNHLFSNGENETPLTAYEVNNKIDDQVIIDILNFINLPNR